jgi:hypothetical protein
MKIQEAVEYVRQRFSYTSDQNIFGIFDHWSVMREQNGKMYGDCDDFALTSIWKACDSNILTFFVNVFILHTYRIWFVTTRTGGKHAVGYANGLYFDNWTKKAVSKEEFLERTGHKFWFFWPSPFLVFPLLFGVVMRHFKK